MPDAAPHPMVLSLTRARQRAPLGQLWAGMTLRLRAARFLAAHAALWPLVIVPVLINSLLFVGATWFLVSHTGGWLDYFWQKPLGGGWVDAVLRGAWYLVYSLSLLAGLLLAYGVVLLAGSIVASRFHDALSEKTEQLLLGRVDSAASQGSAPGAILRSLGSSILITLLYALTMALVLAMHLVPGVGTLAAAALGPLVSANFLSLEYCDPILGRRGLRLGEKFQLLGRHPWLTSAFGLGTTFCLWVPLLNFLMMPLAVIAATALGAALLASDPDPPRPTDP